MKPRLKGLRYQPAPDSTGAIIVEAVTELLPFCGWREASAFYDTMLGMLGDDDDPDAIKRSDIAFLGCNDRYFLLTRLCGRKGDMIDALLAQKSEIDPKWSGENSVSWLYDRCREVEADPDGYLDLWARYHYKSTIITFAGTIQDILDDPDVTICIFSAVKPIAQEFLAQIKEEFEGNDLLKAIYPDVLWSEPRKKDALDGRPPKWGIQRGIVVKRKSNPKEATVEAHGLIDGQPTSRHYKKHKYDDVVHQDHLSDDSIKKTTARYELADNLGSHLGVAKGIAGTRYHWADTYGVILEEERGGMKPRIYPATDDGTLNGKPVFLTPEKWADVKSTQRSTVSAQMLLNPVSGEEQVFNLKWCRPYFVRPRTLNVYILGDPSKGKAKSGKSKDTKKLDNTAIAVIGVDAANNKYLLDGYRHRMSLSVRWQVIRDLYRKWKAMPGVQLVEVGYEVYGMQTDLEYFKERMLQEQLSIEIKELNWVREGNQSKNDRIERLEPDFRIGRFFLPGLVYHPTKGNEVSSDQRFRLATWKIGETDDNKPLVTYSPFTETTSAMQKVVDQGEPYRQVEALKRIEKIGQDGDVQTRIYDVTRDLMEELRLFPFAPHDDFSDAVSRIYDVEAVTPIVFEDGALDPETFIDT